MDMFLRKYPPNCAKGTHPYSSCTQFWAGFTEHDLSMYIYLPVTSGVFTITLHVPQVEMPVTTPKFSEPYWLHELRFSHVFIGATAKSTVSHVETQPTEFANSWRTNPPPTCRLNSFKQNPCFYFFLVLGSCMIMPITSPSKNICSLLPKDNIYFGSTPHPGCIHQHYCVTTYIFKQPGIHIQPIPTHLPSGWARMTRNPWGAGTYCFWMDPWGRSISRNTGGWEWDMKCTEWCR